MLMPTIRGSGFGMTMYFLQRSMLIIDLYSIEKVHPLFLGQSLVVVVDVYFEPIIHGQSLILDLLWVL